MISSPQQDNIIEMLEMMARRPAMYFGSDDNVPIAEAFLDGFNLSLLSIHEMPSINLPGFLAPGWQARGWNLRPLHATQQMHDKGFSDKEIVEELIYITISCWKNYFTTQETY